MKLPLELVPTTCWHSNVRSQVTSPTWERIRHQVSSRAGEHCQVCGRAGTGHPVECHEIWGYDDAALIQRLEGLIALCPDCHLVKHFGRAMASGRTTYALSWFARVNDLPPYRALALAKSALALHAERSRHAWQLDLSWLNTHFGVILDQQQWEIP